MHPSLKQIRAIINRLEVFEALLAEHGITHTSETEVIKDGALGTEIRYEFRNRERFLAWEIEVNFDRDYPGLAHVLLYIAVNHGAPDGRRIMLVNVSFDSATDRWRIRYGNDREIPAIRMIRSNFPERENLTDANTASVLTFLVRHVTSPSQRPAAVAS